MPHNNENATLLLPHLRSELIINDFVTGDHALLDLNRFQGVIPKQVTVRTKSRDSLSSDSIPIVIPAQVLKGRRHKVNYAHYDDIIVIC